MRQSGRGQGPSGTLAQEEHGTGAKVRTAKAKWGKGSQNRPASVARECFSNSSQQEGESGSQTESLETRRSRRRRKPVDKMRGVMIEIIQGKTISKLKTHNSGRAVAISLKLKVLVLLVAMADFKVTTYNIKLKLLCI